MKHGQYDPEESYSEWQARVNPPVVFYYLDKDDMIDVTLVDKGSRYLRLFNTTPKKSVKESEGCVPTAIVSGLETLEVFTFYNDDHELVYRLFARSREEVIKLVERLIGKPYDGER